jgi:hypothetical protein
VQLPKWFQVSQITKLMKAIEHATDSTTNRAAFKMTELVVSPAVFPSVAMVTQEKLMAMIDES